MATKPFLRASTCVLCLVLASLTGCGKSSSPAGPAADSNAALYGTWIGTLTGPARTQPSGWSAASRDSIWVVIGKGSTSGAPADSTKYFMAPTAGSGSSLSLPEDTCFFRYPTASNSLSDPNVSFRVNFSQRLMNTAGQFLDSAVPFVATRSGNTLTGSMTIPGDTLGGNWTATLCTTCPYSSATTSIEPNTRSMGDTLVTLRVNGANFTHCSVVRVDGSDRATKFVSANQLTITITALDQAVVRTRTITVFTPPPGGGASNGQTLTIVP